MNRRVRYLWVLLAVGSALCSAVGAAEPSIDSGQRVDRPARISPDYSGTVVPPNIAPLNFLVAEPGSAYRVVISSDQGDAIALSDRQGRIVIPPKPWSRLLDANRGGQLSFDVSVCDEAGRWRRFPQITNTIGSEDINRYLTYRLMKPLYNRWVEINIYQRDLSSYSQQPIWRGRTFEAPKSEQIGGCINCHAFCDNRTEQMAISYRSSTHGSGVMLAVDGKVTNLDTKFGYTAWHPSGRLVAYSRNKVRQFFHSAGVEIRDVIDLDSSLAYYVVESGVIKSNEKIDDPDRMETYPTWSPDGKHLYFSSAPILWADRDAMPPANWRDVRYDLMRISYDVDSDTFGQPETLLTAEQTGKSILIPRVSPDGRFVVFCMTDYGCFPIYQPSSDLYIMDLQTKRAGGYEYRALQINSDRSESWHNWSTEGRWMVFTSKRRDGLFARPYLTYIDGQGKAHKPVLVPQEDPAFYDSQVKSYTVPELTIEPVRVPERSIIKALRNSEKIAVSTAAGVGGGSTQATTQSDPWRPAPSGGTQ